MRAEDRLHSGWLQLEAAYEGELRRQRGWLLAATEDAGLLRGLALGSTSLVEGVQWLRRHPQRGGSKGRKVEKGLARYLSRTVLKLSPFSTLTRTALAEAREAGKPLVLLGHGWRQRSLVRMSRRHLEACLDLLCGYPPFYSQLEVELNDSLEETGPDRYLLLRPGRWAPQAGEAALRYLQPAIVQTRLAGPLVSWLFTHLPGSPLTVEGLLRRVARELGGEFHDAVQDLIRLGLLVLRFPWPADDPHLEARLLAHLQPLAADPGIRDVAGILAEILRLEGELSASREPQVELVRCRELAEALWDRTVRLAGLDVSLEPQEIRRSALHEDVFLINDPGTRSPAVAQVARGAVQQPLAALQPLLRLSALYDRSDDFLASLGAFCHAEWPGSESLPLLAVLRSAMPLWQQFVRHEREIAGSRLPGTATFNPLGLASLDALREARERCSARLSSCVEAAGPASSRIAVDRLCRLLAEAPRPEDLPRTACLFLQPVDAAGEQWLLNRALEGGRHHSRYTAVMSEELRDAVSEQYRRRSVFAQAGQRMEVVDVLCSGGSELNVHAPQTWRAIEFPGERSSLPASRRLALKDLRLRLPSSAGIPFLADRQGQRVLPLHVGSMLLRLMPLPLKFLRLFGPRPLALVLPEPEPRSQGELLFHPRLLIGNTILRRCRWVLPADAVRQRTETLPAARAFVAINRWRMEHGLPDRVFLPRPAGSSSLHDKPVYIDFTSPVFVELFRDHLKRGDLLTCEEVLPRVEDGVPDAAGERWAVELQLDSTLLQPETQPASDPSGGAC